MYEELVPWWPAAPQLLHSKTCSRYLISPYLMTWFVYPYGWRFGQQNTWPFGYMRAGYCPGGMAGQAGVHTMSVGPRRGVTPHIFSPNGTLVEPLACLSEDSYFSNLCGELDF